MKKIKVVFYLKINEVVFNFQIAEVVFHLKKNYISSSWVEPMLPYFV